MRVFFIIVILLFSIFADTGSVEPDSLQGVSEFSLKEESFLDSHEINDTLEQKDSSIAAGEKRLSRKEKLAQKRESRIKRKEYSHRHQVGTALGMMAFLTIILSLGLNINPD